MSELCPARRRRRWKHLFWAVPVLVLLPLGIRVATFPIPVHAFTPDGEVTAVAGAVHVHSTRSDGSGDEDEIARAAAEAGLRFVVLTDHNVRPRPPRYRHGVLLLFGTEVTTRDGHLLALDFQGEPPAPGTPAHEALLRVRQAGGFTLVAHGHDPKAPWQRWDLRRLTGMELYNAGADARRNLQFPYGTVLAAALSYPLNPEYALLLLHERPARDLARFDALARERAVVGLCGLDAHGFPGYARLFRAVRTYVAASLGGDAARDARTLWDALRRGRHHCSFDLYGDGSRFRFYATTGRARQQMGDAIPAHDAVRFMVELGIAGGPAEIALLRNGEVAARARGTRLVHVSREPGAYRVEVTLPVPKLLGGSHPDTWILSNAIFVRAP